MKQRYFILIYTYIYIYTNLFGLIDFWQSSENLHKLNPEHSTTHLCCSVAIGNFLHFFFLLWNSGLCAVLVLLATFRTSTVWSVRHMLRRGSHCAFRTVAFCVVAVVVHWCGMMSTFLWCDLGYIVRWTPAAWFRFGVRTRRTLLCGRWRRSSTVTSSWGAFGALPWRRHAFGTGTLRAAVSSSSLCLCVMTATLPWRWCDTTRRRRRTAVCWCVAPPLGRHGTPAMWRTAGAVSAGCHMTSASWFGAGRTAGGRRVTLGSTLAGVVVATTGLTWVVVLCMPRPWHFMIWWHSTSERQYNNIVTLNDTIYSYLEQSSLSRTGLTTL